MKESFPYQDINEVYQTSFSQLISDINQNWLKYNNQADEAFKAGNYKSHAICCATANYYAKLFRLANEELLSKAKIVVGKD